LHARRPAQAENRALLDVVPVAQVLDTVRTLVGEILLVRLGQGPGRQAVEVPVGVHVQWHVDLPFGWMFTVHSLPPVQSPTRSSYSHVIVGFHVANMPWGLCFQA